MCEWNSYYLLTNFKNIFTIFKKKKKHLKLYIRLKKCITSSSSNNQNCNSHTKYYNMLRKMKCTTQRIQAAAFAIVSCHGLNRDTIPQLRPVMTWSGSL